MWLQHQALLLAVLLSPQRCHPPFSPSFRSLREDFHQFPEMQRQPPPPPGRCCSSGRSWSGSRSRVGECGDCCPPPRTLDARVSGIPGPSGEVCSCRGAVLARPDKSSDNDARVKKYIYARVRDTGLRNSQLPARPKSGGARQRNLGREQVFDKRK